MLAFVLFGLFVLEIAYILFIEGKPKRYRYKQLIKSNNGRAKYRIDYIASRRW